MLKIKKQPYNSVWISADSQKTGIESLSIGYKILSPLDKLSFAHKG
jgi:PIN domain nuclease of toxin-antitoxin system